MNKLIIVCAIMIGCSYNSSDGVYLDASQEVISNNTIKPNSVNEYNNICSYVENPCDCFYLPKQEIKICLQKMFYDHELCSDNLSIKVKCFIEHERVEYFVIPCH